MRQTNFRWLAATFQLLSPDVAYLKLSDVRAQDVDGYIEDAVGTRGLVIDIRNYPSESVVFALGTRLITEPTPFARFTRGDLRNPGAFTWSESLTLQPESPGYAGNIAILVDEISTSHAEYTAMALSRRAAGAGHRKHHGRDRRERFANSAAGRDDGDDQRYRCFLSRQDADAAGRRIIPDIVATPTIEGIREGRDEVLEAAFRHLLGPDADDEALDMVPRGD